MLQRSRWLVSGVAACAILLFAFSDELLAQEAGGAGRLVRPGGYLSVIKLGLVAIVFLVWVRLADWVNRDAMKIGEKMEMEPEVWNPIVAFPFFLGFWAVISVPIFFFGFPIYATTAFVPFTIYYFVRRGKIKENPNLLKEKKHKPGDMPVIEELPQDEGADVEFTPAGDDKTARQANLIRARQTAGFNELKELVIETQFKRTEQFLMDFTRDGVSLRILVDGAWHALEPMTREVGDEVLSSLKFLAGMDPQERRARQSGRFKLKSELGKAELQVTSQGVPTGERVQVKYTGAARKLMKLGGLGMFPDRVKVVKEKLDTPGMTIVSAPPGGGLTSTWQGTLATADRLTRDCVAIIDEDDRETGIENIVVHHYDQSKEGKDQFSVTKAMMLTQPDFLAFAKVEDAQTMDFLTHQVLKEQRSLVLLTPAKSAAEALLRLYAKAGDRQQFLNALNNVYCQRLVRRLCDNCKVEMQVPPKTIQALGGNPNKIRNIYSQWRLPPPEQRVDENGKEIEFPPCEACGGIGYIGRIAVFEMITLDDKLRAFIAQNPKLELIEKAAQKMGKVPLENEAYKLVLHGVTSMDEVKNVMRNQA